MKHFYKFQILISVLFIFNLQVAAQTDLEAVSSKTVDPNTIPSVFKVGLGTGVNLNVSEPTYNYYISPIDNTLKRDKISNISFVGSVIISFTPLWTYKLIGSSKYFKAPGPISFLASYNLSELNSSTGFNSKLNGGLGIGINIQNSFQIALFADFFQTKTLRNSITEQMDQKVIVGNNEIVSLDQNDTRFYYSDFRTSISLKFIYILSSRSNDFKSGVGKDDESKMKALEKN